MIKQGWLVVLDYGEFDSQSEKPIKMYLDKALAETHANNGNDRLKLLEVHCSNEPVDSADEDKAIAELGIPYTGVSGCEYKVWGPIDVEIPTIAGSHILKD